MVIMSGKHCSLYKYCEMCGRTKWYKEFSSQGYIRKWAYCKHCKQLYSFDISKLEGVDIEVRIKLPSNRKVRYKISNEEARRLVREGMAGIVHQTLIHKFYDKQTFKKRILERDNYTCFFCSKTGDTVDHLVPKIRGGISSFSNCVCACRKCNKSKGELPLNDFLNCIEPLWTNEEIRMKRVKHQIHYIKELFESLNGTLVTLGSSELNNKEEIFDHIDQLLKEIKNKKLVD
ncbi:HNH endonuclease [Rossellomorea aquimaris]|uniref:HNH endonuclease n=1 Tax=Rossellomorea aquimaris TaxID=189382 RepID=A0A5D4TM46_9BACI|nr:HNH endonuclease [Rossellomorea aquimaris]TYS76767.1 HNH endonuclease [Rossellomorea aquimaris]TYS83672.1 HNH endonuclease [Rossellomorea aquimaris]